VWAVHTLSMWGRLCPTAFGSCTRSMVPRPEVSDLPRSLLCEVWQRQRLAPPPPRSRLVFRAWSSRPRTVPAAGTVGGARLDKGGKRVGGLQVGGGAASLLCCSTWRPGCEEKRTAGAGVGRGKRDGPGYRSILTIVEPWQDRPSPSRFRIWQLSKIWPGLVKFVNF
jgi:hypothetical protein